MPAQILDFALGQSKSHPADAIYKLQGGNKGIEFERTPEGPELDGIVGGQVDSGITSVA